MNTHVDKTHVNKSQLVSNGETQVKRDGQSTSHFSDNKPEAIAQRKLQEMANISPEIVQRRKLHEIGNNSPQVTQLRAFQEMAYNSPQVKQMARLQAMVNNHSAQQHQPIQKKENKTSLPDNLKTGVENLSGISLDDVKVHLNSDKPAQLQAHAYAQGTDIYLGAGQEKHLPHEAWHVVQQKQGRVKPTVQLKGKVYINDDPGLEKEADVMGNKAQGISKLTILEKELKTTASSSNLIQAVDDPGLVKKPDVMNSLPPSGTQMPTMPVPEFNSGEGSVLTQPDKGKPSVEHTVPSFTDNNGMVGFSLGGVTARQQIGKMVALADVNAPSAEIGMGKNGLTGKVNFGGISGMLKRTSEFEDFAATWGVGARVNFPSLDFKEGEGGINKAGVSPMAGFGLHSRDPKTDELKPLVAVEWNDGLKFSADRKEIDKKSQQEPRDSGLGKRFDALERKLFEELGGAGAIAGPTNTNEIDNDPAEDSKGENFFDRIAAAINENLNNPGFGERVKGYVEDNSLFNGQGDLKETGVKSTPVAETEDLKEKGFFDNFISWWNRPVDPRDERLSGVDSDSSDDTHYSSDDTTKTTVDSPESNNDSQANTPDSDSDDDSDFWDEPYHDY